MKKKKKRRGREEKKNRPIVKRREIRDEKIKRFREDFRVSLK